MKHSNEISPEDRFYTLKGAAAAIGLPYFKILQAVNCNLIPSYTLYNKRRYVRLADIRAAARRAEQRQAPSSAVTD